MSGLLYQPITDLEAKGKTIVIYKDEWDEPIPGEIYAGWSCPKEYGGSNEYPCYGMQLQGVLLPDDGDVERFKAVFVVGISYQNIFGAPGPEEGVPYALTFNILLATTTPLDSNSKVYVQRETVAPTSSEYPRYNYGSEQGVYLQEHSDGIYLYKIGDSYDALYPYAGQYNGLDNSTIWENDPFSSDLLTLSEVSWFGNLFSVKMLKYSKETTPSLQNSVMWFTSQDDEYPADARSAFWQGWIWEESTPPYGNNSSSYGSGSSYGSSSYGGGSSYGSSSYGSSSYGSDPYGGGGNYGGGYSGEFTFYEIANQNVIYGFVETAFIDFMQTAKVKVNPTSYEIWETNNINNFKLGHYLQSDIPTIDAFDNPPEVPAEVVAVFKDAAGEDRWSLLHSHQLLFKGRNYSSKFSPQTIKILRNSDDNENILIQQDVIRIKDGNNNVALRPTSIKKNGVNLISYGTSENVPGGVLPDGCLYVVYN